MIKISMPKWLARLFTKPAPTACQHDWNYGQYGINGRGFVRWCTRCMNFEERETPDFPWGSK